MLSSLLRPKRNRQRVVEEESPFPSPYTAQSSPAYARRERIQARHASADFTATEDDEEEESDEERVHHDDMDDIEEEEEEEQDDEDEDGGEEATLLPIFSAAHLGSYNGSPVWKYNH